MEIHYSHKIMVIISVSLFLLTREKNGRHMKKVTISLAVEYIHFAYFHIMGINLQHSRIKPVKAICYRKTLWNSRLQSVYNCTIVAQKNIKLSAKKSYQ